MNDLNRLVCSPEQSRELLELGIEPRAFLWHFKRDNEEAEGWATLAPTYSHYDPNVNLPAWTKAELEAMIGANYRIPHLIGQMRDESAQNPNAYPVYTPTVMFQFTNGAQAAACGLLWLLKGNHVNAWDANARYQQIFINQNPEENGHEI